MAEAAEVKDKIPDGAKEKLDALKGSLEAKKAGNPVAAFALERLNAAKESRYQLNLQIRSIRNLPEFEKMDAELKEKLHALQSDVEQTHEMVYRVGTETAGVGLDLAGKGLSATGGYVADTFKEGSPAVKVGIVGGAVLLGSQMLGWIKGLFREGGKKTVETVKGWGTFLGKTALTVAAGLGIASLFGYNVKAETEKDDAEKKEAKPETKKKAA